MQHFEILLHISNLKINCTISLWWTKEQNCVLSIKKTQFERSNQKSNFSNIISLLCRLVLSPTYPFWGKVGPFSKGFAVWLVVKYSRPKTCHFFIDPKKEIWIPRKVTYLAGKWKKAAAGKLRMKRFSSCSADRK